MNGKDRKVECNSEKKKRKKGSEIRWDSEGRKEGGREGERE